MRVSTRFVWCFLILTSPLKALYNGNPDFPMMPKGAGWIPEEAWISVKTGYQWDGILNRKLKFVSPPPGISRKLSKVQMMGNSAVLTVGLRDRVEGYATLGDMRASYDWNLASYDTGRALSWSVGGRAILAYWSHIRLSLDAKYFEFCPEKPSYKEWQVGASVGYCAHWWVPYMGIKHSNVSVGQGVLSKKGSMRAAKDLGVFLGLGVVLPRWLNVNMEVRLVDEVSFTASGDFRF